ncbi:MAG: recombinase zinc beta ribbon domain-containing protein, partial [Selenomonadaceae bacterium]|nr:recombinase zinc beta ribbon domain-containing protein [Selenomonadaceae bacterium]
GDLLMGKSFTVDPISHRRLPNKGEANRYLVQDHHPAIIPRTVFDKAQEIRESRGKNGYRRTTVGYRKSVPKEYVFSGMIECAFCHSIFTRRISHSHTPYEKIQWGCMKKTLSGKESYPHSKAVDEDAIKKAFVESYSIICRNNEKVVDELMGYVQEFFESHDLAAKVTNLQKELEKMRRKRDHKTGFQDELDSRRFKKGRGSAEGTATTTDGILDAQEMSQKQNIEVEDLSQKQEVDTGVFALAQMTGGYENCIETGMCICPTWAYAHPFFMSDCSPSHSHALSDGDNPRG